MSRTGSTSAQLNFTTLGLDSAPGNTGHAIINADAEIPEPSTYLLFATVLGLAGGWKYRVGRKNTTHPNEVKSEDI